MLANDDEILIGSHALPNAVSTGSRPARLLTIRSLNAELSTARKINNVMMKNKEVKTPARLEQAGRVGDDRAAVDAAEHLLHIGLGDAEALQPGFQPGQLALEFVGVLGKQPGQPGHSDDARDHQAADDDRVHPQDQYQRGQPAGCAAANHHPAQRVHRDHQHQGEEDRAEDDIILDG